MSDRTKSGIFSREKGDIKTRRMKRQMKDRKMRFQQSRRIHPKTATHLMKKGR